MQKKNYVVIDVNSTYVTCAIAGVCQDGTLKNFQKFRSPLLLKETYSYDSKESINAQVYEAIEKMLSDLNGKNCKKDVIVSISADKLLLKVNTVTESFARHRKLNVKDLIKVSNKKRKYDNTDVYDNFFNSIIGVSSTVEEYGAYVQSRRNRIKVRVSSFFCEKVFLTKIKEIFRKKGYNPVFVAGTTITLNHMLTPDQRKQYYLAIDTDNDSTSLILGHINGIEGIKVFKTGTDQISAMVKNTLKQSGKDIDDYQAKSIVEGSVITNDEKYSDDPDVKIGVVNYSTIAVNVIKDQVTQILNSSVDYLYSEQMKNGRDYSLSPVIYLMGDGIATIKGIKNFIENYFYNKAKIVILSDKEGIVEAQDSKFAALISYSKSNIWQKLRTDR